MTIEIIKCCLACKHLDIDPGCDDWSELTAGDDPSVRCRAGYTFELITGNDDQAEFSATLKASVMIEAAAECGMFEVNPELIAG